MFWGGSTKLGHKLKGPWENKSKMFFIRGGKKKNMAEEACPQKHDQLQYRQFTHLLYICIIFILIQSSPDQFHYPFPKWTKTLRQRRGL